MIKNAHLWVYFKRLSQQTNNQPLAIIMPWLMGRPRQLVKYAELYLNQGFDVLMTETNLWDLLRPSSGSQVMSNLILNDFICS